MVKEKKSRLYILLTVISLVFILSIVIKNNFFKLDSNYQLIKHDFNKKYIYTNIFYRLKPNSPKNKLKLILLVAKGPQYKNLTKEIKSGQAVIYFYNFLLSNKQTKELEQKIKILFPFAKFRITNYSFLVYNSENLFSNKSSQTFLSEFIYDSLALSFFSPTVYTNNTYYCKRLGLKNSYLIPMSLDSINQIFKNRINTIIYFKEPGNNKKFIKNYIKKIYKKKSSGYKVYYFSDGFIIIPNNLSSKALRLTHELHNDIKILNKQGLNKFASNLIYLLDQPTYNLLWLNKQNSSTIAKLLTNNELAIINFKNKQKSPAIEIIMKKIDTTQIITINKEFYSIIKFNQPNEKEK